VRTRVARLLPRCAGEAGYTLVELLTVLLILGTVLGGLTALFVSASRAEIDMNERFQAQQNARLALSRLRREVHCAKSAATTAAAPTLVSTVTLTPSPIASTYCTRTTAATWCTVALGANRFGLFRKDGTACDPAGVKVADHLTDPDGAADGIANVFSYVPNSVNSLAKLNVDFPVDVDPVDADAAYRLQDSIALRKSGRTG
jgi:prepilin-type N-terminal cleavage/methylation domain-containing protein